MIPPAILALAESGPVAATILVVGGVALNLLAENVLEPTRWVASLLARDEEPVPRGVGRPWASPPRDAADAPPEGRG